MSLVSELKKVSSPYGFSMLGVEATQKLERVSRQAQDIVRGEGFERIMPAMVDYPETFSDGGSSEIFSLKDNSGERLALRNDITAQVIKGFVRQIESRSEATVRKFYYAAPVYKDVRKNYPLPREIYQIGCEVVGDGADTHLKSLLQMSNKILTEVLGLNPVTHVSHVGAHRLFAEKLGPDFLKAEERRNAPAFADMLAAAFGVEAKQASLIARRLFYPAEAGLSGVDFSSLPKAINEAIGSDEKTVELFLAGLSGVFWQPLTMPRSSYYSGIFFETYVEGVTEPIARGGVYNDLIKRYAEIDAGACGFALDLVGF